MADTSGSTRTTTATWFQCADAATGTGAQVVWSLQDGSSAGLTGRGTAGTGGSGHWDNATPGSSAAGPCPRDAQTSAAGGRAVTLVAASGGASANNSTSVAATATLSVQLWFRTTTHQGLLVGLREVPATAGATPVRDRVVFLTATGQVVVGLAPDGAAHATATSPAGTDWADGRWHHLAATFASSGMRLYLDGALAGQNLAATSGHAHPSAYVRVGYDDITSWASEGAANGQFVGDLAWFSAYQSQMSPQQVLEQCRAGRTSSSLAATDPATAACNP